MKNCIAFMKTRPEYHKGNGRETAIVHQYASLIVDFLMKNNLAMTQKYQPSGSSLITWPELME
jgi:hypothetical protein